MNLAVLGWDDSFASQFLAHSAAGLEPARVALHHKNQYEPFTSQGLVAATCTGRLIHTSITRAELPAVGDWVAVRPRPGETHADIHAVLPRRTCFSRRAAGDAPIEQIIAANIDTVLLVTALDQNFNLRRIERYLAAGWESGAQPVIVLNKADLHSNPAELRDDVQSVAGGTPIVVVSASEGPGLEQLAPWLQPGRTLALLGSSGVGKSTLINRILGHEHQATGAVSAAVGKGQHTTTHRELILTPSGAVVIDTPGMRELQLWEAPDATPLEQTFTDITALAAACRFRDCAHHHEPGCAIQKALESGELASDRWESFQKLQRQQAYAARKSNPQATRVQRDAWRRINQAHRARTKYEGSGYEE